ncbi:UDP-glucuronosyl/UDP-glucosyltransferase protein [Dioscorea alata]|uniref:UDP-glucuronosyl/UDP-glucosyltransferase protein n=1 Tax=Dioscorea alata TaxID=55571 RepID=A0ACB7W808_DIOAL|nr:UDP-glucuronosyl/UDP-glucosyltransferase protein [Dioscorea alata]
MAGEKPHVVCLPFPAQDHINPMLKLSRLLHSNGFHITFVNTEYNHRRLLRSRGTSSLDGLYDFCFKTIPDGLLPSDEDTTQDICLLFQSTMIQWLVPFRQLLTRLNGESSRVPPVTCVVSDGGMCFTLDVAKELLIPDILFWTTSCLWFHGLYALPSSHSEWLNMEDVNNGYLETVIDWILWMKNMRLRDIPTFIRTTNHDDTAINFIMHETKRASMGSAIILNTFNELEHQVLEAMASMLPPVYTIGPLSLLSSQISESPVAPIGSNLWKEEPGCMEWLGRKKPKSVVYLIEFAWGLTNSKHNFLWIIRPDLVRGDAAVVPQEFMKETQERGLLASWCSQEEVLEHPSIRGFLTHCGWNSTLESVCGGVPVLCWPFFAEQQTNCRYLCTEWGMGMEIGNSVKKEEVEGLIKELINGEKGMEMRKQGIGVERTSR